MPLAGLHLTLLLFQVPVTVLLLLSTPVLYTHSIGFYATIVFNMTYGSSLPLSAE